MFAKPALCLIPLLFLCTSCQSHSEITLGDWTWNESGTLSVYGQALSPELAANKVAIHTPLGTFHPKPDGGWWRKACRIPLPKAGTQWVQMTITSEAFTDAMKTRGYYHVGELAVSAGCWQDIQLDGTPADWVYIFKNSSDGTNEGTWLHPSKLTNSNLSALGTASIRHTRP